MEAKEQIEGDKNKATEYTYDNKNRLTETTAKEKKTGKATVHTYSYNAYGDVATQDDTTFTYGDVSGQVTKETTKLTKNKDVVKNLLNLWGIRMRKTILKVIILAFFILLHKNTVYAGDEISFTINNEPPQDALIIGRVSEVHNNQNYISIDVVRIVVGKICEDHVNLQGVDTANYSKGDGILFSAKFIDNKDGITQCRAVYHYYKVDLKTDNKVRILPSKRDSKAQAIELEWFVNTGEGTGGSNDMIYCMSEDDNPEFIYDLDKDKWLKNSFDKRYTAPDVKKELQKKRIRFCVVGGILIVLVGVFCFTKRMHKKRLKKRE